MEHIKRVMHGESKTRLYRIWSNLKNRVLPNSVKAKYYFDRGIGLCDEWKNSFISFRDWSINNGYDDKLTLDRIDNDGSYTPENCRWVDMKTQANNRSNNITVYADKECVPFSDVCRILGVDYNTAYGKIIKHLVANKNVERTAKNWKEPVGEYLEKAAVEAFKEIVDDERNNFLEIFKAGAKWQITKLMLNATEVTVHIDTGGYPYIPQMELYDYDKDIPLAKEGNKYKVVLIKED